MRTLVTGGAGFIGSHLVELLLSRGDEVTVIDDLSTGAVGNLDVAGNNEAFRFVRGSILDRPLLAELISQSDRVFHLAAAVGVRRIVEEPLGSLRVNVMGSENVLELATEAGVGVLLASTSEIYGKNESDSLSEDSDRILGSPLVSRWSYAAAKGIDEAFAHAYWRECGLRVSIVRLFNTVGPRQVGRYGMVVPNLVRQALSGQPLTVFGDGTQTRCFSYVADVVPAMVALQETDSTVGRAVNLGGSTEISILALAERIIAQLNSTSTIRLVPYADAYGEGYADMRRRVPNNTLAGELIGWTPTTGVDEIIQRVAAAMRDNPESQLPSASAAVSVG